jgi:hypothetical protein
MIAPPSAIGVEEIVVNLVLWLKLVVEAIGALVIGAGMFLAGHRLVRAFPPAVQDFIDVRLTLARFLAGVSARCRHPVHRGGPDLGSDRQARGDCRDQDGAQLFSESRDARARG